MHDMCDDFNSLIEDSIKKNWDLDALTDYKGTTLQYKDVARKIEKLHILFEESGVKKGDNIAICGRNSSQWAVVFLAILSYGAVAVPILHEFKADNVHHIVNHSEAKLLFVGDVVWENLNENAMPILEGIILIEDFSLLISRNKKLLFAREHLNELFGQKYPKNFRVQHIAYYHSSPDELAVINYTSGTTSYSKGVMLPYRSLLSNIHFAIKNMPLNSGDHVVSILPLAHMYGLEFEFLFEFCLGCQVFFLTRMPSPKIIFNAFAEVKPDLIITVPLIIEKVVKKAIFPKLETPSMKLLLKIPLLSDKIKATMRDKLYQAFGGKFREIEVGGASFNADVEDFLRMVEFPYTVGYGMTECGPLITYASWKTYLSGSCGRVVDNMEMKVVSSDPQHVVGEVYCRGKNVMLGYFKNKEATDLVLDKDGWLHTGDLGIIDEQGNLFLKGRCKDMLLSSNGQNIYPEEIEEKLNNLPYVAESIVVQQNAKLVALIYPDYEEAFAHGLNNSSIEQAMEENRKMLNTLLPAYSQVSKVKVYPEEFEKTPKKSIKRYLYQEAKG